jgi:ASC-1-like (ASCH) protein
MSRRTQNVQFKPSHLPEITIGRNYYQLFDSLRVGTKLLEIRTKNNKIIRDILENKTPQEVIFTCGNEWILCIIDDIRQYIDFEAMLAIEDFKKIAPLASDENEVLAGPRSMYSLWHEALGVVVLEIRSQVQEMY